MKSLARSTGVLLTAIVRRWLVSLLLLSYNDALAMSLSPPPSGRPVIIGTTSDYSTILFGKLQRAANLYGTNLQQPLAIVKEGDDVLAKGLERCLWNQFYMANPGPDGVLEEEDLIRPLSAWIPQADLKDALVFFDAASPARVKKSIIPEDLFSSLPLPFLNNSKAKQNKDQKLIGKEVGETQGYCNDINIDVLKCAVQRQCAHIYVLATTDTLMACQSALEKCADSIPSTIVCLQEGLRMVSTKGWVSSREQNMEGDFINSMKLLQVIRDDDETNVGKKKNCNADTSTKSDGTIPVEDVVEIIIQISLRTERENVASSPKIVQLSLGDCNENNDLVEKPNSDYFTMMGGKQMKELSGTVKTVTSWEQLLSPLGGEINTQLCRRPDKAM